MNDATISVFRPEVVPGERIFLSHLLKSDVPLLARWLSDLEMNTYLGAPGMSYTLEQEQAWFDSLAHDKQMKCFAIIVRDGQKLIGSLSLMGINHQQGTAELGIGLGDKTVWGQGYGGEAVRLICDYGFTFLGLSSLCLWHSAFNERGHRAYLRAGFKEAGRWRDALTFNGRRYDRILMDLTRADFGPSRLAYLVGQVHEAG